MCFNLIFFLLTLRSLGTALASPTDLERCGPQPAAPLSFDPYVDNLLLVVGGDDRESKRKSEIVDLTGQNRTCPDVPDYKYKFGMSGVFIGGQPILCGGKRKTDTNCYSYKNDNTFQKVGSIDDDRTSSFAVKWDDQTIWILSGGAKNSTILYHLGNGSSTPFVAMPDNQSRKQHVVLPIGDEFFFLVGDSKDITTCFLLNRNTLTWTKMPDYNTNREGSAGMVTFPDGSQRIYITDGESRLTTQYVDLPLTTDSVWQAGPSIPVLFKNQDEFEDQAMVQLEKTFLLVGGDITGESTKDESSIWYFDPLDEAFKILPVPDMKVSRSKATAILLPNDYISGCV